MIVVLISLCCLPTANGAPDIVDTRTFGKPRAFDGTAGAWRDWAFAFLAYCSMLDSKLPIALKKAEATSTIIPLETEPEALKLQQSMFYILVMLVTGAGLSEIRNVPHQNGWEAWRRLYQRYEPSTRNRQLGLLDGVLHPQLTGTEDSVLDKVP